MNMCIIQAVVCPSTQRELWPRWVDGHTNGRPNELKQIKGTEELLDGCLDRWTYRWIDKQVVR
jgi:hypothetical protein